MRALKPPLKIAVAIATSDRFRMLSERSLPSVIAQKRPPDMLVVVDGSAPRVRPTNAELAAKLQLAAHRQHEMDGGGA